MSRFHVRGPESERREALLAAQEFTKYLTALATGSLVFSASLLSENVAFTVASKWAFSIGWVMLAVSIAAGLLANSRVVIQLWEGNHTLNDRFLELPGRLQQLSFLAGVVSLGLSLMLILYHR